MLKTLLYGDIYQTCTTSNPEPVFVTGTLDCLIAMPSLAIGVHKDAELKASIATNQLDCNVSSDNLTIKLTAPSLKIKLSEDCTC